MSRAAVDIPTFALREDARQQLQAFAQTLSHDELLWASGYLAGQVGRSESVAPADAPAPSLTVLYATETGNSRRLANDVVTEAERLGLAATAIDVREIRIKQLKKESLVVFIAATHGLGDAPEGSEDFFEALHSERAPTLDHLTYSVLSLGDSSYDDFCAVGIELDARLNALGARRFAPRVDCDVDYDQPAQEWRDAVLEYVAQQNESRVTATPHLRPVPSTAVSRSHPYPASILANQRITASDSSKTVHHLELDIDGSGLDYEPGDAIGVVTRNPDVMVDALIDSAALDPEQSVTVNEQSLSLRTALTGELDISASSRRFIEHYARVTGHHDLQSTLNELSGEAARTFFHDHQVVDVVRQYPGQLSAQNLVDGLRRLTPRLYSIASSPLATPDEVHLTVAQVTYRKFGFDHVGSASTVLLQAQQQANIYVQENPHFRLPGDPDTPIIMIGPGTGIAPFRAFVAHREAQAASGKNWLFFGDREFRRDFLYQTEWQRHIRSGALARLDLAFSRDQADKIYVQHRLREHAHDVYDWLENGAHVYVCGDAERMAIDVHNALLQIVASVGGHSIEQAEQYLRELQRSARYQKDVY